MAPPAGSSSDGLPAPPPDAVVDRHSPTPAGYVAAGALAVVLFGVVVGVALAATLINGGDVGIAGAVASGVAYGFAAGVLAAVAAVVAGLPLSLVAHVTLGSVRSQSAHVVTFGLVGALTALACLAVFGFLGWQPVAWFLIGAAGVCTALSRLVVGRRQGLRTHPAAPGVR